MVRQVKGLEAQLDADLLRSIASVLGKLNQLREVTQEYAEDTDTGVRISMPEVVALTRAGSAEQVGEARRRSDGTWYLSAVIAE
jgi:predicted secreted protein